MYEDLKKELETSIIENNDDVRPVGCIDSFMFPMENYTLTLDKFAEDDFMLGYVTDVDGKSVPLSIDQMGELTALAIEKL